MMCVVVDARVMQTALAMQPADFEVFAVCSEVPVEMTFCLKEFRVRVFARGGCVCVWGVGLCLCLVA